MKHSNTGTEQVAKPSTLKELAAMYNVSTKTIRTWLLPPQTSIGKKTGRYYTSLQVRIIFDKLGTPWPVTEKPTDTSYPRDDNPDEKQNNIVDPNQPIHL